MNKTIEFLLEFKTYDGYWTSSDGSISGDIVAEEGKFVSIYSWSS